MKIVTREDLERELAFAAAHAAGPAEGLFGPQSVTWQVAREAAVFFGAGRAMLMQLAHPWVAAAIEQHSDSMADPIARFHRTFGAVHAMVFGSLDQCLDAARGLHARHARISGNLPAAAGAYAAGSFYCANEQSALLWVYATLVDSALIGWRVALPALDDAQRERYYAESRRFASLFGIPQSALPQDWKGFSAYMEGMLRSDRLYVTAAARAMGHRLLTRAANWLPVPTIYRVLSAELVMPSLRGAFAFRYSEKNWRAIEPFIQRCRRVYPRLPERLRTVGPYQEALQRLAGRHQPDLRTQMSNRLWIGRRKL